jgi:hypothetical protein
MASLASGPAAEALRSREDLIEQCRQEMHGNLDPLPRQFTTLPNPGWSGRGLPYEAVQTRTARHTGPLAQAVDHPP